MRIVCIGGFIDYTSQLVHTLRQQETVMFVIPVRKTRMAESLAVTGEKVDSYLFARGRSRYHPENLLALIDCVRKLKRFKPDVVHMQLGSPVPYSILLPFIKGYPLVGTFHDVRRHLGEESLRVDFLRYWVRKCSDEIIVHGEKLKEQMVKEFNVPAEKVHAIHIGEHEVAQFKKYERADLKEDGNLILFFGRIYEYKGLEYLIKAEPLITKEVPDARIIIAGAGEDFKKYEDMMGNRRDRFIVHNYHIPYKEGAELLQRSSVVVLPYIDASQSGVVPTAYGFKKPVVVTDVGSVPEAVEEGKTGFIVPPRDSEALARAVIRLLRDEKLRRQMGENAYQKLKEDFSWDNIARRTIEVYKKAIEARRKGKA
ncbi:glycosyltransferase family 4 protein [Chloroflexota bacterium]